MKKITSLALADYILASYPNKDITPMKLQKLAYYTKVWTLVAGLPVVDADFQKSSYQRGSFHLLQDNTWHSFTLDMTPDEATAFESYPSFDEYVEQSKKAENDFQEFFKEIFN